MFRLLDAVQMAIERLWQFRMLVLWALFGLGAATTLALSLPLYVDAVNSTLLSARLDDPPYNFRFRYLGTWNGNIAPADATTAGAAVMDGFTGMIDLPATVRVTFARSQALTARLTSAQPAASLGAISLAALDGVEARVRIVAGAWDFAANDAPVTADGPIPALLPEKMLYSMGINIGDTISVTPAGGKTIALEVVAFWTPLNAADPGWIFPPKFFNEMALLHRADLDAVLNASSGKVEEAGWQVIFDGSSVDTAEVGALLTRIADGLRLVEAVLPGIRLEVSPIDKLRQFNDDVTRLTQQLVVMVLPVGGLVFYFVALIAGLLVSRQQGEDVTLRSRGMTRFAIVRVHFLMWLILALAALGIAFVLAPLLVQLVGRTTSFLRFDGDDPALNLILTPVAAGTAALTGLTAASSGMLMAWRTSRQTITSFRRQTARARRAWWQATYLDVMILLPAYYVLYALQQQGGLTAGVDDPFSNPIVFLGPTLFAFGNTLLFLRVWPTVMRFLSGAVAFGRQTALLMALRELTRSIQRYRGTLLMICFTLSQIGFTASMASTMDQSLRDTIDYRIGADAVLILPTEAQTETSDDGSTQTVTGYNILPASDLLNISGVESVSRVGRYTAQLRLGNRTLQGTALGVDRAAMAAIARFRGDYATTPLADMMNLLAVNRTGILLDSKTMAAQNLKIGQKITYRVQALNQWYEQSAPILGVYEYFPTLAPDGQEAYLITTLDSIWEAVGFELPHDIWMALAADADQAAVQAEVKAHGFPVLEWRDPEAALKVALANSSRRGVLGFLSAGFVAAIALTLVGSMVQNAASFQAQAVQLGSLRAMGLSSVSVAVYLLVSQGLAVTSGILSGTGIGAATSLLFLPLLDFSDGLPPYMVRVAWTDILTVYLIFAGVLFGITLLTTLALGRQRLFTIVKLGDAA